LPAGRKAWGAIYSHIEAWEKEHGHPVHSEYTLENQFKAVSLGLLQQCIDFNLK